MLKEGLRGIAAPNGPGTPAWETGSPTHAAHQPGGTRNHAHAVVGALGAPAGDSNSQRPGHTSLGGPGVLPRRWSVLKGGLRGTTAPNGLGTPALRGRGVLLKRWWVLKEGLRGAAVPNGPGRPALGGRGGLPRRWWVVYEGLRGTTARNGTGTPACGAVESSLGGGGCTRRASGDHGSQWPRHPSLGERGVLPRRWSVL